MAKRLNKNIVMGLTALAFIVLTAGGVLMVRSLRQADPREHADKAKVFSDKGEYDRARTHYQRAFSISEDPQYLVTAGEMAQLAGKENDAIQLWYQAITLNPELLEPHLKLLDYLVPAERWIRVKETAEDALKIDDKNPKALHAEGLALIQLADQPGGDLNKGLEDLEQARTLAPEVYEYSATLIRSYWSNAAEKVTDDPEVSKGRITAALELARSLVSKNPGPSKDAASSRSLYASRLAADFGTQHSSLILPVIRQHLEGKDRYQEAERLYQEAIQAAGTDPETISDAMAAFAAYWFERGQAAARDAEKREAGNDHFAKASDWARQAINAHRPGFMPYQLLAQVHGNAQEYNKAAQVCEERLALPIERKGLKAAQAKINRIGLLLYAAEQYVAAASGVNRGTPEWDEFIKKANQHVDDALAEFPDWERAGYALHIRGKIKVVEGKDREAVALFEKADTAANTPRWQNKRWMGILQARLGQFGAALEALREAVRDPRADYTTWITLAKVYSQFDDLYAALQAVDEAIKLGPDQREAKNVKAVLLQKLGRLDEAEQIMQTVTDESEPQPILRASGLASQGKFDEAYQLVAGVVAEKPTQEVALRALTQYAEKAGKRDEALATVRKAAELEPNNLAIKSLVIYLEGGSDEERKTKFLDLIQQTSDEYLRAVRLAGYHRSNNNTSEALDAYAKAVDLILKDATPQASQAGAGGLALALEGQFVTALDLKRWDQAESAMKLAADHNVDGAKGHTYKGKYHLARTAGLDPKSDASRQEWEKAAEAFKLALVEQPTDADSLTWLGECEYRADRVTEAKARFKRAADINPSQFRAQFRLADLAEREGQTEEFNARLDQCQKLNPEDSWVKAKVMARQEERNPQDGIARREAILKENPADMDNLMQLARLYSAVGNTEQAAESYAAVLADAQGYRRAVWPATQFFLQTGDSARAFKTLSDAIERAETPELKSAFMMMTGTIYRQAENIAESDRQFRNAVDLSPTATTLLGFADHYLNTGRPKEALPWLEKAIEAADKAATPQADPATVRRMRIETLLKLDDREAARTAVKEYASLYPKDPTLHFLNSEVDFASGEGEKAIASLSRYLEQFPNNASALYRRAQLYGNLWKWQSAIKDLENLRAVNPDALEFTPRIMLALAYDLEERSDLALSELKTLYEQHPENERVCREFVSYYLKHDREAEALSLATALVNREPDKALWHRILGQAAMKFKDGVKTLESLSKAAELSDYDWRTTCALFDAFDSLKNYEPGIRYYLDKLPADRRVPPVMCRYAALLASTGKREEALAAYRDALKEPAAYGDELFVQEVAASAAKKLGDKAALDLFKVEPEDERLKRPNQHILSFMLYNFDFRNESVAALDSLLNTSDDDEEKASILTRKGVILEEEKNYEGAKQCYEEAVKYNQKSYVVLNNLAFVLSDKLNKPADAVPYAERAAQISGQPAVIDTLGWCRVQLGQYSQAIGDLSKALMIDPQFVPAHVHRAEAFRRSERFEDAAQGYEAALKIIETTTMQEYINYRPQVEAGLQKAHDKDKSP